MLRQGLFKLVVAHPGCSLSLLPSNAKESDFREMEREGSLGVSTTESQRFHTSGTGRLAYQRRIDPPLLHCQGEARKVLAERTLNFLSADSKAIERRKKETCVERCKPPIKICKEYVDTVDI